MGTIVERRRKDGSAGYMAQIKVRREGQIIRETRTFDREQAAKLWLAKREKEIASGAASVVDPPLGDAIDRYISESRKAIGKTKAQVLAALKREPIAQRPCSKIESKDITELAADLAAGRGPATVANYLSHLAAVFAIARPAWGYPLDRQAMADATIVAKRLGITARSNKRERRPTAEEIERLIAHFEDRQKRRPSMAPMTDIIVFGMFSTRRLDEICRIRWADLDLPASRVMVRDMKNPGEKIGNDVRCDLTPEAIRLIEARRQAGERIFPYNSQSISASFARACLFLGIEDLHFHDLRHEGISRLFEMGWTIPHVAAVSGHRSWVSLKRYTHIHQTGDKWAGFIDAYFQRRRS